MVLVVDPKNVGADGPWILLTDSGPPVGKTEDWLKQHGDILESGFLVDLAISKPCQDHLYLERITCEYSHIIN